MYLYSKPEKASYVGTQASGVLGLVDTPVLMVVVPTENRSDRNQKHGIKPRNIPKRLHPWSSLKSIFF